MALKHIAKSGVHTGKWVTCDAKQRCRNGGQHIDSSVLKEISEKTYTPAKDLTTNDIQNYYAQEYATKRAITTNENREFLAYDKVHHSQYEMYQKYAQIAAPSPESRHLAIDILGSTPKEDTTFWELNDSLRAEKDKEKWVRREYNLFAIRDASGDNFDVYLLDEDSLFLDATPSVPADNVFTIGEKLLSSCTHKPIFEKA